MNESDYKSNKEIVDYNEFSTNIRKLNSPRTHKVTNSYGMREGFKYYKKYNSKQNKFTLTLTQFTSIIREVNKLLRKLLLQGNEITLPNRLGRLEIRKYKATIAINNGRIKTNLPIDWDKTIKLWYEDEEACKNKTLIKMEEKEIFKIYYNRAIADFTNKTFYQFNVNRDLKRSLKVCIRENNIDAFNIK